MSRIAVYFITFLFLFISCSKKNSDSNTKTAKSLDSTVEHKIPLQKVQDNFTSTDTLKAHIPFSAMKIAVGGNHSLIVNKDSTLWVSGLNDYGQLGFGDTVQRINLFKQVMTEVFDVAAGTSHSLVLKGDGSLWAAGWNYRGEFGTGDTGRSINFIKICENVTAISARGYCSMIIKSDSTLWVTGKNECYHLGLGGKQENTEYRFVKVLSGVRAVSVGLRHSLALKWDGTVWGTGDNSSGQLGWKNSDENNKLRDNYSTAFLQLMTDAKEISAGGYHSLILKNDSTLWATGWNEYGQLGTGDHNNRYGFEMVLSKVIAIAGGNRFTMALRTDGILWTTGGNGYGEFPKYGIHDEKKRTLFRRELTGVALMATSWDWGTFEGFRLSIKHDGTVWGFGKDGWGVFGRKELSGFDAWTQIYHY